MAGSYALYGAPLSRLPWLPACSAGLFITAVLNINNIRDMANDFESGKETLALRLGPYKARVYNSLLVGGGLACWVIWSLDSGHERLLWLMPAAIPLLRSTYLVYASSQADVLDAQLRVTSLSVGCFQILLAAALPMLG